jgi:uncharacterized protein YdeI (YjbR/CyaY-like superfamily)
MNPKVDAFIDGEKRWKAEFKKLREILLGKDVVEELKWGVPCYTVNGKNIALIHGFKEYCAILFVKGALLADKKGILVQQTENVQAGRQIRFAGLADISKLEKAIGAYVDEAIELEKAGRKVEKKTTAEYAMAEEFRTKLDRQPRLKEAFEALTPGRQKAYLLHFSSAKQSATRESRIEKCIPRIMDGLGIDD